MVKNHLWTWVTVITVIALVVLAMNTYARVGIPGTIGTMMAMVLPLILITAVIIYYNRKR